MERGKWLVVGAKRRRSRRRRWPGCRHRREGDAQRSHGCSLSLARSRSLKPFSRHRDSDASLRRRGIEGRRGRRSRHRSLGVRRQEPAPLVGQKQAGNGKPGRGTICWDCGHHVNGNWFLQTVQLCMVQANRSLQGSRPTLTR